MALRLILMRHAKSGWDDPLLPDHDRPLAPRGHMAAGTMSDWLQKNNYLPDEALVSTALRTRETWARLGLSCPVTFLARLYHAGPDVMLAALQRATGNTVLMIGHNPGIAEFARMILSRQPKHPRFADYPTAATLVAEFQLSGWAQARYGCAQSLDFAIPKDLGSAPCPSARGSG